jgi:tetratricopeptide (TPR) repeat protein
MSEADNPQAAEALAVTAAADAAVAAGQRETALQGYRSAIDLYEKLAAADPENALWQHHLSTAYYNLGGQLWHHQLIGGQLEPSGDREGALAAYRTSAAISERNTAAYPEDDRWQRGLATAYFTIASLLASGGDREGALVAYRASLAIREKLAAAADPAGNIHEKFEHYELSMSYRAVGDMLTAGNEREGALTAYGAALVIREKLVAADPGNEQWRFGLSGSHENIGDALAAFGDREGALTAYRAALVNGENLSRWWPPALGVVQTKIGDVLAEGGNRTGALAAYRSASAAWEREVGDPPFGTAVRHLEVCRAKIAAMLAGDGNAERQNSDLVSPETVHDNPVPGETITPRGEPGSPRALSALPVRETRHEVTRPAEAQPGQSVSAEAGILSELPATLRGRGYVKRDKPEDPHTVKQAYRAVNAYSDLKKQGHEFDDAEKAAVRAGWRVTKARYRRNRKAKGQNLTNS